MNNENSGLEVLKEAVKEVASDVYEDAGKPIAKPTGELIGLVPRAIKAALSPLEKWIMQKEYNIAETQKLLELKLQNVPPELIEVPEPYIAVPILQYISYCMDCNELRDMYANLLANSMNKVVKNGVHPSFVEIIKQLSPDEAKILKYLHNNFMMPTLSFRIKSTTGGVKIIIKEFSNIPRLIGCENPLDCEEYFDNLSRLGLIERVNNSLSNKELYSPLLNDPEVQEIKNNLENHIDETYNFKFGEHYIELSPMGKRFCNICLDFEKASEICDNSVKIVIRGI